VDSVKVGQAAGELMPEGRGEAGQPVTLQGDDQNQGVPPKGLAQAVHGALQQPFLRMWCQGSCKVWKALAAGCRASACTRLLDQPSIAGAGVTRSTAGLAMEPSTCAALDVVSAVRHCRSRMVTESICSVHTVVRVSVCVGTVQHREDSRCGAQQGLGTSDRLAGALPVSARCRRPGRNQ
jgi:hypothetical protein